jgi:hypothetical protein
MATVDSTLPISYATDLPLRSARSTIRFDDNSFHVESLSDDEIVDGGQIVFEPLTPAERDTVLAFYTTNKNLPFDFVNPVDGLTYTLHFTGNQAPTARIFQDWKPFWYTITYIVVGA